MNYLVFKGHRFKEMNSRNIILTSHEILLLISCCLLLAADGVQRNLDLFWNHSQNCFKILIQALYLDMSLDQEI